ncbi:serine/arginine repetitive matrix protein 1-like [Penaeus japonicus]|uniref:serine/arginine repetitive matrix protein 1-like n=1 Tax=Penaeus japonicus TaxID=27405 RepID=UPI001C70D811|nr:serine/arginine repetitive matrix protein 1-like [Penaeus japonicus]XP_042869077.1 serine/arginine repetitive matrix protein 1-like [Penaeus japonicus]
MSEADRKYVPFWKWWLHKSASSPSLAHKTYRAGGAPAEGVGSRRVRRSKHTRKELTSLETLERTPEGLAKSQDSSEDIFFTPRENMKNFFSNDDLLQAHKEYWRDGSSSEALHKGSGQSGTGVDSSESFLEEAEREKCTSSRRGRRALSTSQLSGRQMAPELLRPRPLGSQITAESRSASSLGLKRTQTAEEMEVTREETSAAGQVATALDDSRKRKSKKGKRKQDPDIKLTKRTLSLTQRAGKGRRSLDNRHESRPYTNEQYKGFDIYKEIEDARKEHRESRRPSQEGTKKESRNLPMLDTADAASLKGWDDTDGTHKKMVTSPVYDVLTPTEIWQRRSSARHKDMQVLEGFARNRSASDVNTRSVGKSTLNTTKQRSASVTDDKPILSEKVKHKFGRKKNTLLEEDKETVVNEYDRPGPPIPIYQSPPPPREVGDMSSFQPIPKQTKEEQNKAGEAEQEERTHAASEHSDASQPVSPKDDGIDKDPSSDSPSEEKDASVHTVVRRTQSEKRTSPVVVKQHQRVKRSHSEPRSARTEVAVPADALQPIIDDHLVKHNEKVLRELGIDLEALGGSDHKPAVRITSTSSTDSSLSIPRRRPSSLPPPPQGDDNISPVSEFGPSAHDPRTRLSFSTRPAQEPVHTRRSPFKPAPPLRSPTTKLTSVPGQHSPSSQSSNLSTPRSSPQPPRPPHPAAAKARRPPTHQTEYMHRSSSLTSVVMLHETPSRKEQVYGSIIQKTQFRPLHPGVTQRSVPLPPPPSVPWAPAVDKARPGQRTSLAHPQPSTMPVIYDSVPKPRRWSLALSELPQYRQVTPPDQEPRRRGRSRSPRQTAERQCAREAVKNWVIERLSYYPPDVQSLYFNQRWTYRLHPSVHPTIQEEIEDEVFEARPLYRTVQSKTKSSSDSDHSVGGLRTASLDRLGRRSNAHPAAHAHAHAHTPHYTLPRRPPATQRYQQQPKGKGYGYSPPSAVFDDDPGIMSEAETSSTGFRRGGKQRASLPVSRTPSAKTLDSRFEMDDNSYWDEDPGIMSEAETSSTGRGRNLKPRTSLPIVRTPSKTLERPLGLVFLQYRGETKRALLPNEITSLDTVKALFVRSFPNQLTMQYLDLPSVKIYIHDSNKDMFYDLEDLSGTCFVR